MTPKLPLRKLVVECRYKPRLEFYGKMDEVGLDFADEFPDWERSPLTLELRNKKKHRRLFLSVHRAFVDIDDATAEIDFGHVEKVLKKAFSSLPVKDFTRIGVRQWFAADLGKTFALMVDQVSANFLKKHNDLDAIFTDKTKDVAYVADFETEDGWRYNLRLGPMIKSQWFQMVGHEPKLFETGDDGVATFELFKNKIPEQFLFMDLDSFQDGLSSDQIDKFLGTVRRRSHEVAEKLIAFCKK